MKQLALIDIHQNNISIEEASKLYNIPEEELREETATASESSKPEENKLDDKVQTAKEAILNQTLELLTEVLTPKDLKDLLYVVNNIVPAEDEQEEGFTVTIKKLLNRYGDS